MKNIGEVIETYALLTVAAFLMSLGVVWIFNSEQIVPGGVTGIGIIIENLTKGMGNGETGIPVWLSNLVINIPLFICGYFLLEKKSMIRTAYTTAVSTVFMAAIPTFSLATQDKLLNMILGGVMFGCAYGLMFRQNASSGGVDLMALILNHLRHDIGAPLFLGEIDLAIVVAGGLAFGFENMLYAVIAIAISTKLSDVIVQGLRHGKLVYIISSHCGEIKACIMNEIGRGVTVLNTRGGYTNEGRVMIISVLSSRQLVELKDKIRTIDENSFLIVGQVTEVFGEGFTKFSS
jgi:uncharacterized membrane-anchored protein YitT (DUF2179 family)